jgi:hypothetical protein
MSSEAAEPAAARRSAVADWSAAIGTIASGAAMLLAAALWLVKLDLVGDGPLASATWSTWFTSAWIMSTVAGIAALVVSIMARAVSPRRRSAVSAQWLWVGVPIAVVNVALVGLALATSGE